MLEELRQMFEARGFLEGSNSEPGHFVIEKAFVGALNAHRRCAISGVRDRCGAINHVNVDVPPASPLL